MTRLLLSMFALCALLLAACDSGGGADSASSAGDGGGDDAAGYLVVFSQANNAEPYRAAQNQKMNQLWDHYPDVEFQILDAQQDNSRQISQIETTILRKPDLLIVAPNERGPLTGVMKKAMEAGIPIICLERDILEPFYTTYVRSDNRAIGRMAGQFIVDHLTEKYGEPRGKVIHMRGLLGVEGEINRHEGAMEILSEYPDIEFPQEAVADWLQSKAKDRMTEILRVQPEIDVVYGHNDPMAVGAYLAARELGRKDDMIFIGVDGLGGEAGGVRKVMDGVLGATFVYPLCVDKAVEIGNRILRDPGFAPQKEYLIESQMITAENAEEMYEKFTIE